MKDDCLICERISQIQKNINSYFVAELETGYVVIGDYQFFKGYTLLLCKEHVFELHQLKSDFRQKFLIEMSQVAETVYKTFNPKKLNYELLGNSDPHLHWHLYPRYEDDPLPNNPIWQIDKNTRAIKPTEKELLHLKKKLLAELKNTTKIIRTYE